MPCTLKIRVISAKDLPIMDRSSKLTDAFVTVRLTHSSSAKFSTECVKRSLNPVFNEMFRMEIADDILLQDYPLEFKVWDKDYYSTDDSVGLVLIDLNPLLCQFNPPLKIHGWFPIMDSIHGIRGHLRLSVKVQFFGDINPFKDTAVGLHFFGISCISPQFRIRHIHGFVEACITEKDPEYHWTDSFRASRTSNEFRQSLFAELGHKIRRNVGKNAIELGANAVVGYKFFLDLQGESGVTARAIGTAVTIAFIGNSPRLIPEENDKMSALRDKSSYFGLNSTRNSSEEILQSNTTSNDALLSRAHRRDIHLLTMSSFPSNLHVTIGGMVSARAVKLLDKNAGLNSSKRQKWWSEIRKDIKSHAAVLNCSVVVGYREETTVCGDLCVLSAYGTAARGGWYLPPTASSSTLASSSSYPSQSQLIYDGVPLNTSSRPGSKRPTKSSLPPLPTFSAFKYHRRPQPQCALAHIPYSRRRAPFRMHLFTCGLCTKRWVPEILLTTLEIMSDGSPSIPTLGEGALIEARVCRARKSARGEVGATIVSEALPFIEYDLHRQLIYKLRVMGRNAAFAMRLHVSVGENLISGVMTATAVFLPCLPAPPLLNIRRYIGVEDAEDRELVAMQKSLMELSRTNHLKWMKESKKFRRQLRIERRYLRKLEKEKDRNASTTPNSATPPAGSGRLRPKGLKRIPTAGSAVSLPKTPIMVSRQSDPGLSRSTDYPEDQGSKLESYILQDDITRTQIFESKMNDVGTEDNISADSNPNCNNNNHNHTILDITEESESKENLSPRVEKSQDNDSSSSSSSSESEDSEELKRLQEDDQSEFSLQIDDEADEDVMASICEPSFPSSVGCVTTESMPGWHGECRNVQLLTVVRRVAWEDDVAEEDEKNRKLKDKLREQDRRKDKDRYTSADTSTNDFVYNDTTRKPGVQLTRLNRMLSSLYHDLYALLAYQALPFAPCFLAGLRSTVLVPEENTIEVRMSAMCIRKEGRIHAVGYDSSPSSSSSSSSSSSDDENDSLPLNVVRDTLESPASKSKGRIRERDRSRRKEKARSSKRTSMEFINTPYLSSARMLIPISPAMPPLIPLLTRAAAESIARTVAAQYGVMNAQAFENGTSLMLPPASAINTLNADSTTIIPVNPASDSSPRVLQIHTFSTGADIIPTDPQPLTKNAPHDTTTFTKVLTPPSNAPIDSLMYGSGNLATKEHLPSLPSVGTYSNSVMTPSLHSDIMSTPPDANAALRIHQHSTPLHRSSTSATGLPESLSLGPSLAVPDPLPSSPYLHTREVSLVSSATAGGLHTPTFATSHPLSSGLQGVEFTPLSSIPGAAVDQFVGRVRVTVIKEIWNYKDKSDGLSAFVHTLLVEAHTLCRAHVMSRNGNALLGYVVDELRVIEEKGTQVYAIISMSGDAARVVK